MQQSYSCPNCGNLVQYGDQFCQNCGAPFDWGGSQEGQDDYQQQADQYGQQYSEQPDQYNQQYDQQYGQGQWDQQQGWGQPEQPDWGIQGQQKQQRGFPARGGQVQRQGYGRGAAVKGISNTMLIGIIIGLAVIFVGGGIFLVVGGDLLNGQKVAVNTQPALTKPVVTFTVNPTTITAGQSANLAWDAPGATSVTIAPDIGEVAAQGTTTVTPGTSTSYTLTASNSAGSTIASAALIVNAGGAPTITSFEPDPANISAGGQSTLRWDVKGATSVTIDNDIGPQASSGSKSVSLTTTTTYTLTATNSNGSATATATVTIKAAGSPVISSFTANKTVIVSGESSTLQWSISGATSVTIDGVAVAASNLASGTKTVSPTANTTYTLVATNNAGFTTARATVSITTSTAAPVISNFTANPMTIITGSSVTSTTLHWDVSGATSLTIGANGGATENVTPLTVGEKDYYPQAQTIYTLTATNSKGSTTRQVTVYIAPENSPVIYSFAATPFNVTSGQSVMLTWDVPDASSVKIDQGVGKVSLGGPIFVSPTSTTTYKLSAYNGIYGPSYASVTVFVNQNLLFSSNKYVIRLGESATLSWNVVGSSVVLSPPGMTYSAPETEVVAPSETTTYMLDASGMIAYLTITVVPADAPVIDSFTVSGSSGSRILNWDITGATSITISPDVGSVTGLTSKPVTVSETTTFTIAATNTSGATIYKSVTVTP